MKMFPIYKRFIENDTLAWSIRNGMCEFGMSPTDTLQFKERNMYKSTIKESLIELRDEMFGISLMVLTGIGFIGLIISCVLLVLFVMMLAVFSLPDSGFVRSPTATHPGLVVLYLLLTAFVSFVIYRVSKILYKSMETPTIDWNQYDTNIDLITKRPLQPFIRQSRNSIH